MTLWSRLFPPRPIFRPEQNALQVAEAVKQQLLLGVRPDDVVARLGHDLAWGVEQARPIVQWECVTIQHLPGLDEPQRLAVKAFIATVQAALNEPDDATLKAAADIAWGETGLNKS